MNSSEIQRAVEMHADHPVLSKATRLLSELYDLANAVSDGWAYWPKPGRAAKKLMELIQRGKADVFNSVKTAEITESDLRKAVAPIKAFLSRERKPDWPEIKLP